MFNMLNFAQDPDQKVKNALQRDKILEIYQYYILSVQSYREIKYSIYINIIFRVYQVIEKYSIEPNTEIKAGRFPKTKYNYVSVLFRNKGSIAEKDVTIAISPTKDKNYINPKIENQLVIPKNIIKKLDCYNNKKYELTNLQLNIRDYTFISQFSVQNLWSDQGDIILGSLWMATLGSFILNTKKFLTFSYKKKKKKLLQDVTVKPNSLIPEDILDISKVIFQNSKKSTTKYAKRN